MGLKTRGNSQFHFLAFNRILKDIGGNVLSIGIVRDEDFSEQELIRLHKWALKNPENHITLFVHPYKKTCKVIAGEKYVSVIYNKETEIQTERANALLQDNQFIKGVHELAEYIRLALANKT
ncbi:hypothetical protein [Niastella sp. OAS944]|uniref:hypothetical protein n=1 Tax=Niastella sp. OAS944 TaxID=2664089 RepID=UPI0035C830F4|nr:hypothetical protein [Chitinophagaceae bacterium OAS944]